MVNIFCPAVFPLLTLEILEDLIWFFVIMEICYKLIQSGWLLGRAIILKIREPASYVEMDLHGRARNEPAVSVSAHRPLQYEGRLWGFVQWQIGFQTFVIPARRFLEISVLKDSSSKFTSKIFNGSLFGEMPAFVRAGDYCMAERDL